MYTTSLKWSSTTWEEKFLVLMSLTKIVVTDQAWMIVVDQRKLRNLIFHLFFKRIEPNLSPFPSMHDGWMCQAYRRHKWICHPWVLENFLIEIQILLYVSLRWRCNSLSYQNLNSLFRGDINLGNCTLHICLGAI